MKLSQFLNKKGSIELQGLAKVAVLFVVIGVIFGVGFSILTQQSDTYATCPTGFGYSSATGTCLNSTNASFSTSVTGTYAYNTTQRTQNGMSEVTGYMPTIGLVVAAVVVIGLVVGLLYFKNR